MRRVFIFFMLSIVFFGLFSFMISNLEFMDVTKLDSFQDEFHIQNQEDFDIVFEQIKDKGLALNYINLNNFFALIIILICLCFSTLCAIHLVVDKMFFKTFYQQPDLLPALRRGFLLSFGFCSIILLRVLAVLNIWLVISILIIIVLVEYMFMWYHKQIVIQTDFVDKSKDTSESKNDANSTENN